MKKEQIAILVNEGVLGSPLVRATGLNDTYYITFQRLSGQGVGVDLVTARGALRQFKTLDAAASLVRDMGINKFEVLF